MGDPVKNGMNGGMDLKDLGNPLPSAASIHHFLDLVEPSWKPVKPPQCSGQSIEKPPSGGDNKSANELKDGLRSNNTIMGICDDDFGVIAVESRMPLNALKVVQISSHIGLVGSGSEPIFNLLKECITGLSLETAMASTMKDAVNFLTMCVEDIMKSNPNDTDHEVYYIVVGKMNNKFEMYTISNSDDDDHGEVISKRVRTRIVNGGSGDKALSTYQKNNKPLGKWIEDYEAAEYCFKCMKHALTEDNVHGGGDINMVVINNDGYKPLTFRKSDVYGYCLEP